MADSPVTKAAIARLGVQVALPSRGDIARGIGWLPNTIAGVFKAVNQKKHAELNKDLDSTKAALHDLTGTEKSVRNSRDAFIRKAEQESLGASLKAYKKSVSDGQSIVRRALEQPYSGKATKNFMKSAAGWGTFTDRINRKFDKIFKSGARGFDLMRQSAETFYSMDKQDRQLFLKGLQDEVTRRQDIKSALNDELKLIQKLKIDKGGGEIIPTAAGTMKISEREEQLRGQIKGAEVQLDRAKTRFEFFGKTLDKTTEGTKKYNQEVKTLKDRINRVTSEIQRLNQQYREKAVLITQNIGSALSSFREALQQSVITLTLFYYKLNQVVQSFIEFEKELMNAQSIFQTTNETLFTLSNQIVRFGTEFGISYDNAAKGLYQFASAGLSAEDSIKVLNDTLKLSMAVQGDHNTISKLTTQVIFGFGLQMDEATAVTDKFAHAINKSLIEYQDLASAVKFSMPFFVSSGQSLDTLLGALQVLTNRALEAGIAGRGLRQALAEFTQHADDNAAAFRKLGVEILDSEGNMKELTNIAHQFNAALGDQASDMEVMMTLMDDLNVRGATAFIHLVQNADEFTAAVKDLENSTGSAHEMAMIQQQSLFNQIQILKNALLAPFLLADPAAVAKGEMNEFATAVHGVVANLKDMLIVETETGQALTEVGYQLRNIAMVGLERFGEILDRVVTLMIDFTEAGVLNFNLLKLYFLPLSIIVAVFEKLGPNLTRFLIALYILNKTLPITQLITMGAALAAKFYSGELMITTMAIVANDTVSKRLVITNGVLTLSFRSLAASIFAVFGGLAIGLSFGKALADTFGPLITIVLGLALAVGALYVAFTMGASAFSTLGGLAALTAGFAGVGVAISGIGASFAPDAGAFDMSGYEAQLEGNYALGGNTSGGGAQTLNVENLNYTDSNWSQYANDQMQSQAGANRYERRVIQ